MRRLLCVLLVLAVPLCMGGLAGCRAVPQNNAPSVRISIPYHERFVSLNDSYYKAWLEERTGLSITFTFLSQTHTREYLRILLSGNSSDVDAIFFAPDSAPAPEELAQYAANGTLAALDTLLDERAVHLPAVFAQHTAYDLRKAMQAPDGHIYYMPALDASATSLYLQTLWLNVDWLEALGLTLPSNTEQFAAMLAQFAAAQPLGVPSIGSTQADSTNLCHFLMNAFAACDPANSYFAAENGTVHFPPTTQGWRDGLRYCRGLYQDGLLPPEHFSFTQNQLTGLVNDPRDLVGCFPAQQMTDVISLQSPQLLSKFLALPPLAGPDGSARAMVQQRMPSVGGVVLSSSPVVEEVFALMDLMCSEEAFLIGHYGQQGVNWEFSQSTETTITGNPALITVTNLQASRRETPSSGVVGPFVARAEYVDGVVWKGYQTNQSEAIATRAARLYQPYEPAQTVPVVLLPWSGADQRRLIALKSYTADWLTAFVTGAQDVEDDAVWNRYLQGFDAFDLPRLLVSAQDMLLKKEVD